MSRVARAHQKCILRCGDRHLFPDSAVVRIVPRYNCVVEVIHTVTFTLGQHDDPVDLLFPTHAHQGTVRVDIKGALNSGDAPLRDHEKQYLMIKNIRPNFCLGCESDPPGTLEVQIATIVPISFASCILVYLPYGNEQNPAHLKIILDLQHMDKALWHMAQTGVRTHTGTMLDNSNATRPFCYHEVQVAYETNCRYFLDIGTQRRFGMPPRMYWCNGNMMLLSTHNDTDLRWSTKEHRTRADKFSFAIRCLSSEPALVLSPLSMNCEDGMLHHLYHALRKAPLPPVVMCWPGSPQDMIIAATMQLIEAD